MPSCEGASKAQYAGYLPEGISMTLRPKEEKLQKRFIYNPMTVLKRNKSQIISVHYLN